MTTHYARRCIRRLSATDECPSLEALAAVTRTATHSDVRPATQADIDSIRRGDSCELCSLDTTPVPGR
jgi:hypothetical protein